MFPLCTFIPESSSSAVYFSSQFKSFYPACRTRLCQVNFKGTSHRERDMAEVHHACSIANRCQRIQFAPVRLERQPHPRRCPLGARLQSLKRAVKDKALDYNSNHHFHIGTCAHTSGELRHTFACQFLLLMQSKCYPRAFIVLSLQTRCHLLSKHE